MIIQLTELITMKTTKLLLTLVAGVCLAGSAFANVAHTGTDTGTADHGKKHHEKHSKKHHDKHDKHSKKHHDKHSKKHHDKKADKKDHTGTETGTTGTGTTMQQDTTTTTTTTTTQ